MSKQIEANIFILGILLISNFTQLYQKPKNNIPRLD